MGMGGSLQCKPYCCCYSVKSIGLDAWLWKSDKRYARNILDDFLLVILSLNFIFQFWFINNVEKIKIRGSIHL
jgi:hypothetical protein